MTCTHPLSPDVIPLEIDSVALRLSTIERAGSRPPLLCLHGFGSTKEDYADLAFHPRFADRRLIAYDAPGCGATECANLDAISIPFLQAVAEAVLAHYDVARFHLIGHSMGGLTALILADALGDRVISFTNIEGNVAPEDCFLSRQIIEYPAETPEAFLDAFQKRVFGASGYSNPLYAATLKHRVRAGAVAPIFRSMVEISDTEPLLDRFVGLPCAKMLVYGDENRGLSYLGTLLRRGVQLAEIENSGHFPMYADPPALWRRMAQFIEQAEMEGAYG